MKRIPPLTLLLALTLTLVSLSLPSPASASSARTFFAMDTVMTVSAPEADESLLSACEQAVFRLDALLSVTQPTSQIYRLNQEGQSALSPDTEAVLSYALSACRLTGGALDVTLYPVVRAWGFTTGEYRVPTDEEIAALLPLVDYTQVSLSGGVASLPPSFQVDLGAVAKGYASDVVADLLRQGGVTSALIDLGGNIYCLGAKPDQSAWRIGIRDPLNPEGFVGSLSVTDAAVVTSGSYERNFTAPDGRVYGHIFDPATGRPAENGLISVTVTGPTGMECDALTTALYVMGPNAAAEFLSAAPSIDALMVDDQGGIWITESLLPRFTPTGSYAWAPIHTISQTEE